MPARILKDRAARLDLPRVTLVAVSSTALAATIRALMLSLDQIRFGAVLLLSDHRPDDALPAEIEWRPITPLASREAYSRFMIGELHRHITTDFALCIQWDGYVLNAANWCPDFLDHDYIGAPWPQFGDGANVGNGGFSLRSKRLLDICATLPPLDGLAEDVAICRTHRMMLEGEHRIRFAPEALARRFAYERIRSSGDEFGFHGVFNMMRFMPVAEFSDLLSSLEPGMLGRQEAREIMRAAALACKPRPFIAAWRNRYRRLMISGG